MRIVALDGDTKNSTFADKFFKKFPERSTECFIAEQKSRRRGHGLWRARQGAFLVHVRRVFCARLRSDSCRRHF
ncbi:MAG: hypothetical protein WDN00_03490 [Limisphaerales bacterium]